MWFEKLVGFSEGDRSLIDEQLEIRGQFLVSKANGRKFRYGELEVPTLASLRSSMDLSGYEGRLSVGEIVADVQALHLQHPDAVFQAASQFNLLEMVGPQVSPEAGVTIYEHDFTQGPACAIACGAGTIYRNYFVPIGDQIGQTKQLQIDCLEELAVYFNNREFQHWSMQNGYALPTQEGLIHISDHIQKMNSREFEELKGKLKVGVQWNTEVTLAEATHTVTQVYCSALPIGYTSFLTKAWEPFARLVLEATYEATFWAALKQYEMNGNKKLFLTLVGGGVFRNPTNWVLDAIQKSITKFNKIPLEVAIVSYKESNPLLPALLTSQKL